MQKIERIRQKKGRNKIDLGMRCPEGQSIDIVVLDRRGPRRRRLCKTCSKRFVTIEIILNDEDVVHGGLESSLDRYKKRLGNEALKSILKDIVS